MFTKLTLQELKGLVSELRAHHNIVGYSRMKKNDLIEELTARFILRDGSIYLKGEVKAKKLKARSLLAEVDGLEANDLPAMEVALETKLKKTSPEKALNFVLMKFGYVKVHAMDHITPRKSGFCKHNAA